MHWEPGPGETDICCGDRARFYKDRCTDARKLAADVETALANMNQREQIGVHVEKLLTTFGYMIVLLNRFRQFAMLIELFDLLMRVLDLEGKLRLEASVTRSEALRIHLPRREYEELNKKIALMSSSSKELDPASICRPVTYPFRARARQAVMQKDTWAVLIFDLAGDHPLPQLTVSTLISLGKNKDIDVLIYALSEPDLSSTIIKELVDQFKGDGTGKPRWIQLDANKNDEEISEQMKKDNVTFLVDMVGTQNGSRKGLRFYATHTISFLNDPGLPPESADSKWTQFVVDASMLKAVDRGHDTWIQKDLCIFSSWQPPLHPSFVSGVDRGSRREPQATFNIFINTSLDRIPPAEMLWTILLEIPAVVLYFFGHPEGCIPTILMEATEFARNKGLDIDFFHSRVVFWGWLPLSEHIQRIRDIIDLAFTWGDYPGHTSTNACLTAGTPVLAVEGLCRGGGAPAGVPAGMLMFLGLSFMVVPNDETVIPSVVDAIKEFIENPEVLLRVGEWLDKHANAKTSFFDQDRTMNDLNILMRKLSRGEKGILDCASQEPQPQLFLRGANGKIVHGRPAALATANSSTFDPCENNPVVEPPEEIWSGVALGQTRNHPPAKHVPSRKRPLGQGLVSVSQHSEESPIPLARVQGRRHLHFPVTSKRHKVQQHDESSPVFPSFILPCFLRRMSELMSLMLA